ncbi:hypothetical protein P4123_01075 [Pseudomonas aeruginosa]|nr:hypothetical protein [Pseudomonas aeruginosa]
MHGAVADDLVLAVAVDGDAGEAGGGVDDLASEGFILDAMKDPGVNRVEFACEVSPLCFVEFSPG